MSLLQADDISLTFRARRLFDGTSVAIEPKDRLGIVGANGTGKSTLLKILVRETLPDGGRVSLKKGARVGYLPQEISGAPKGTLLDSVIAGAPGKLALEERLHTLQAELESASSEDEQLELAQELADLHAQLAHLDQTYAPHHAHRILVGLGFGEDDLARPVRELSGGWRMRAALAGLLFQKPDVLLLDEPTNHLDMPSVAWLDRFLHSFPRALVLICHDREFLNKHVQRVLALEIEGARTYKGNYDDYREQRKIDVEMLERRRAKEAQRKKDLESFVERFRAKATKARQAQSKQKQIEKLEGQQLDIPQARKSIVLRFDPVERTGETVVSVDGVSFGYDDKPVLEDVSLSVRRGDRIAIVGVNGSGKTTLLRLVGGELHPGSGEIELGHKVELRYFAQHHSEMLDMKKNVLQEAWSARPELGESAVRGMLGAFLFSGDEVEKSVSVLSGGEKARVALAKLLVRPGNLLLLDEPTNHLDTESAEKLTASLETFDGTLLFVSHNLDFARRLSNKVWDVSKGGVEEYPGSLGDYLVKLAEDDARRDDEPSLDDEKEPSGAEAARTEQDGALPADKAKRIARRKKNKRAQANLRKKKGALDRKVQAAEREIERLEAEKLELEATLADPETSKDVDLVKASSDRYQQVGRELESALERWATAEKERADLEEAD